MYIVSLNHIAAQNIENVLDIYNINFEYRR